MLAVTDLHRGVLDVLDEAWVGAENQAYSLWDNLSQAGREGSVGLTRRVH